jgi:hypothetical protein
MKIILGSFLLFGLFVSGISKADYPVLTSSTDRCLAEIRQSNFYGNGQASSYPVTHLGAVSEGQIWQGPEGSRICVRTAGDCKNLPNDFFCVGSTKGLSEGQAVTGDF